MQVKDRSRSLDLEASKRLTARQEMGLWGLFGVAREKPLNLAAIVIIMSFAALLIVIFFYSELPGQLTKKDIVAPLFSLITLALGYVFGRFSKED